VWMVLWFFCSNEMMVGLVLIVLFLSICECWLMMC